MANLNIAELDFDTIKSNLKTFLESQSEFTDYDFEGSGLSILLDVLAYNTHYNAYLANMLVNEMFLDSAVKRSSAVSIAKHLGYTPLSTKSAKALLNVTVNNPTGDPTSITLPRYTPFSTSINSSSFTFYNIEPYIITPTSGVYAFNNVYVYEGELYEFSHNVVSPGPDEKYEIPNDLVDTSTMFVTVINSSTDSTTSVYSLYSDLADIDSTTQVYFLEENPQGKYEIYFGDGVIGKKLSPGNIVRIQYLISKGSAANVSGLLEQTFTVGNSIAGSNDIDITVVSNSTAGAEKESISSIRYNAPKFYSTRNRAVTKNDYSSIIRGNYPTVEAVSVWGGEENTPPAYGKVFISLKPFVGYIIDADTKSEIKNTVLKERQMLTITPEFVDPDYLHVNFICKVKYKKNSTVNNSVSIENLIRNKIVNYFSVNLNTFNANFYNSQLLNQLSSVDNAIVSVSLDVGLQTRLTPVLNAQNAYIQDNSIKLNNRLHPNEISSTKFFIVLNQITTPVRLRDVPDDNPPNYDGTGKIIMYNADTNTKISDLGTVNYLTGEITLNSFTPVGFPAGTSDIRITSRLQEEAFDITPLRNQIVVLDDSTDDAESNRVRGLNITVTPV